MKPGQRVVQGQLLGYEGNTGFVISGGTQYWGDAPAGKGTHLHFGLYELVNDGLRWAIRDNGPMKGSIDPLPYISDPTPHDGKADGNLGGFAATLANISRYLKFFFGSSA